MYLPFDNDYNRLFLPFLIFREKPFATNWGKDRRFKVNNCVNEHVCANSMRMDPNIKAL